MRLNPSLPLSDEFQSRIAAQAIVFHGFNMKLAVAELRPDIKGYRAFGSKLLSEPAVLQEIQIIMNRTERNSQRFLQKMWDWLEAADVVEGGDKKSVNELRCTAARILAKGYISEKKQPDVPSKPMVIEGLGPGVENLVSEPVDSRKVM
jgi:hypothetical protein